MFKLLIILDILKSFFRKKATTREELLEYQTRKMRRHLKWVSTHADFYKEYQNKAFELWPLINKAKMMEHFDQLNTQGVLKAEALRIATMAETTRNFNETLPRGITVGLSSGTSGNKGIFLASESERAKWIAEVFKRVLPPKLFKKQKIAFFLRSNSTLYESVRSSIFEFHYFDLKKDIEQLFIELIQLSPDILIAPPSVLLILSELFETRQEKNQFKKVISVAEVLEPDIRITLQKAFKQTIHQVYQATEGFLGSTCSEGVIHLHEDLIYFEFKFLEGSTTAFYPVISDFYRKTQPMIRYELNDILHIKKEKCKCGSILTAIERIEGRSDDILRFNGVLVFPDFFRHAVILASDEIVNYRIVQYDEKQLKIELQLKSKENFQEVADLVRKNVISLFEQKDINGIELVVEPLIITSFHNKFRRVVKVYKA